MLSAHRPFESYPEIIRAAARGVGATAQVAGGVPAMCDGITQGRDGMELSLVSRDVIAMATAIALSHDSFDAALLLGVCDKIVPGLFIGAAAFGHLPAIFVPAGPMPSGRSNPHKAEVRRRYAEGLATREELLAAETESYHDEGTCTFYGTANSNQMLMEAMGLHVPGSAFVNPRLPLRHALTVAAVHRAVANSKRPLQHTFAEVVDERTFVNGIVGLMATGGSTNHTIHLIAMARAVGLIVTWEDMADISSVTPLLARVYPNGPADVNQFQAAGGIGFVLRELLQAGLLHRQVKTVWGTDLMDYAMEPVLIDGTLRWRPPPVGSLDRSIVRDITDPFDAEGGLRMLSGNLGRAIIKTSSLERRHWVTEAPVRVFDTQSSLAEQHRAGQLEGDFVAVIRGQGPRANGMPELHQLLPVLTSLQARGRRVAILTDGRMSGASGKVPAAVHLTPEAVELGPIARLRDGDLVRIDAEAGLVEALVDESTFAARCVDWPGRLDAARGSGRELFARLRECALQADLGASVLY